MGRRSEVWTWPSCPRRWRSKNELSVCFLGGAARVSRWHDWLQRRWDKTGAWTRRTSAAGGGSDRCRRHRSVMPLWTRGCYCHYWWGLSSERVRGGCWPRGKGIVVAARGYRPPIRRCGGRGLRSEHQSTQGRELRHLAGGAVIWIVWTETWCEQGDGVVGRRR